MSREMEGLLLAQTDLFHRIQRSFDNLKKIGTSKLTLGITEARLQALEANWSKFDNNHEKLLAFPTETLANHEYTSQDIPSQVEEAYLQQKGKFLDVMYTLRGMNVSIAPSVPAPSTSTSASAAPRTTLSRIQLPNFSGKYEDWPAFRDLFQCIIGRDSATSQVEKFHYLKTCLKGEAEMLIKNLLTTAENYDCAWRTLSSYYENKRLLVRSYLSTFSTFPKLKNESEVDLRKLLHCLKSTISYMMSIGRSMSSNDDLFVFLAVLDQRSRREWETAISDSTDPPKYEELEQFLDRRLHALESMLPVNSEYASSSAGSAKSTRSLHARKQEKSDTKRNRCVLCHKDHFVMLCEDYKNKSAQDRKQLVDVNGLCFNCFGRHKLSDCASKKVCSACGSRHHSSLHDACREESSKTSLVTRKGPVKSTVVLLVTARVRVSDRYGDWHQARALVDSGSETSIVSEELSQTLKLPRSASSVTIFDLELADPEFHKSDSVDIILGADIYVCIIVNGLRRGDVTQPVAQNTSLGWLLSGAVGSSDSPPSYDSSLGSCHCSFSFRCRIEEDLNNIVHRFWEQEEVLSAAPSLTNEERECEEHYARTHFRQADGCYVVRLPLVSSQLPDFSSTRRAAKRLLRQMESRFKRDGRFHSRYVEFFQQYQDLGYMTRVPVAGSDLERVCYLPHHGVLRESSLSTKLRVVFNGSSSLPSGTSLNQLLHAGPSLLPALFDILLQ
ncbi:hypothetical protein X777_04056 [Ooceraea biroi]|uniref:Peptidase aspartic putative domain-containing protein n=1 Tax=Ooceraea biroi TaxID=2015173 RepID=A0A026X207_OOCBI|nr:hypothetical protein X777_04056 [Ooceraea biroi]